ncbi:MAG TPA: hypothetical protein VF862_05760 [Gemmatimonadales bacterium]
MTLLARSVLLASLVSGALAGSAGAQGILVAPHAVVVDPQTRTGWLQLLNTGTEPVEVTIEAFFGYPVTDSTGQLALRTIEQPDPSLPSAVAWIRAFPRRAVIPAQGRQTVRLLVTPPAGTPAGEYWARLAITAQAGAVPLASQDTSQAISVGLNVQIRTVIALLYRRGAVTTGIAVSDLRAGVEGDSLIVRTRLSRQGNGAYIGNLRGALLNAGGREVARFEAPLGVYYQLDPRFSLPVGGLPPGEYRLRIEAVTDRNDLPPDQLLKAPTVRDSIAVRLR